MKTRLLQRPQQQRLRAPPLGIAIAIKPLLEGSDRRRIRMRFVERANRLGAIGRRFRVFFHCWHPLCSLSTQAIGEQNRRPLAALTCGLVATNRYPAMTVNVGRDLGRKMLVLLQTDRLDAERSPF